MIALLRGRIAAAGLGEIIIDVGGVGYRVRTPVGQPAAAVGDEVMLHTHLAVREDALTIYGFADPAAREIFETLIGVSGVGPKLALATIGTLGADGLRRAVIAEDVDALTVVPGIGKKGAARMILELRERLGSAASDAVPGGNGAQAAVNPRAEVRQALTALGYAAGEVQAALDALPDDPAASAEQLLRAALKTAGRSQPARRG